MSFINFEGTNFTIITDENENPWMIGKELTDYLEIKSAGNALRKIADEDKQYMVFDHLKSKGHGRGGDNGKRIIVSEPGIYQLIMKSRKPEAKKFKHWHYHDVLPSIRKTGQYKMQRKITPPPVESHFLDRVPQNYSEALEVAVSIEKARMEVVEENIELQKEVVEKTHGLKVATKTVEQATKRVKQIEYKAQGYDQFQNYTGQYTLNAAAKIFDMKPHTFTAKLRELKILFLQHGKNIPYQPYIERGWFVVKEVQGRSDSSTKTYFQTFVTPKGLRGLWKKIGPTQKNLF